MSTQNGIEVKDMSGQGVPTQKDMELTAVTVEIKTLQRQAQQMVLTYAIEIGRRLTEAKALVEHGGWGTYIKETLGYSQSTANNFMRLFEEYGKSQQSLFGGESNSQTFGNLTYTQALALLALPAEEREGFVENHDVEGMSTRELEAAIRERDEAKATLENEQAISTDLRRRVQLAENAKTEAEEAVQEAQKAAENAAKAMEAAQKELADLKAKPIEVSVAQADPEKIQEAVDAAVADAEKAHAEKVAELEKKVADAQAATKEAKAALKNAQDGAATIKAQAEKKAQAEVEELRKKLAVSAPELAAFQVHYDAAQREITAMVEMVDKLQKEGHEKASGLKNALHALAKWATEVVG